MFSKESTPGSRDPVIPEYRVETVKGPQETEVSFSPERGGIVTSIKLGGVEILYMDKETFGDPHQNVKGGIPILFPNAGPLQGEDNPYHDLKQHGFARTSTQWRVDDTEQNRWSETLSSDAATMQVFPYDLETKMTGELYEDGSVRLTQSVTNLESEKELPIAMGLHPYFKVLNEKKKDIKFEFPGGDKISEEFAIWSQGGTTSIENPKMSDPDAVLRVVIPDLGTLVMDISSEYERIWIWSLPDKDFICIEPVMRDVGGLIDDPVKVKPGESFSGTISLKLESQAETLD